MPIIPGDMSSVVTSGQTSAVNNMLTKIFTGMINFAYTIIDIFVTFFTQGWVLGALAVILIIGLVYRRFKQKVGV